MKQFLFFIVIFLVFSCQKNTVRKLPFYDTADFTPKWEIPANSKFHEIRPFEFVNQENETFTEKDMDGKICVVDFFFTTCPGICPKLTNSMSVLQKTFLNNDTILLLSHSVTPDKDSVPVLMQYAKDHNVQFKRWKLLTGSQSEIYDLGRKYYFVEEDEGLERDENVFLHTENFVLVDKQRHIRGIYNGLDMTSMISLVNDIRVLESE